MLALNEEMINFLGKPEGRQQELLEFLLQNEDDYKEFVREFFTGEIVRDIANYQNHKRQQNKMTLDEFIMLFEENPKETIELLFQEPVCNRYVEYMDVYNVSPDELYRRYTDNPNRSYLGLVKSENQYESTNDDFLLTRA